MNLIYNSMGLLIMTFNHKIFILVLNIAWMFFIYYSFVPAFDGTRLNPIIIPFGLIALLCTYLFILLDRRTMLDKTKMKSKPFDDERLFSFGF
ncbi:hypothetical protein [Macrococcus brunensis]|uniref:hypothetical protein n=1 Tax=Macrococcus brunensis TaxID=198483 RepID=UPI001EF0594F|nr:hypothetical protein [Macrococcus brunensis]ULG72228.1 hypothetical protein MGG12_01490 [Macrococcus brunensis]